MTNRSKAHSRKRTKTEDVVRLGPIEIKRSGKFISMRNLAPADQHADVRARYEAACVEALHQFRTETVAVEAILAKYDPALVMGLFTMRECLADPETYEEPTHKGSAVKIEHIALLYAKHAYPERFQVQIDDGDLQMLANYADRIPFLLPFMYDPSVLGRTDSIDEVRSRIISWYTGVRMPAYQHQYFTVLRDLFAPFESRLIQSIGFSCDDIIRIEQAVTEHANDQINHILAEGMANAAALLQAARGEGDHGSAIAQVAAQLGSMPAPDAEAVALSMAEQWCGANIGHALPLSVERLTAMTGISAERIRAALEFFALHYGDVPASYVVPEPQSMLHTKPVLTHDGLYFVPSITLFLPAIQSALEHVLNPARNPAAAKATWDEYVEHRKLYAENKSLEFIAKVLKGCTCHRSLKYRLNGRIYELDGLILFDRTLLFVEVKAGAFSPQARSGDADAVVGDIAKLINEAHEQANRAHDYYEATVEPVFNLEDGARLTIDKAHVDRCLLVTVTLEQLGALTGDFNRLPGHHSEYLVPWALSLWDLEIVSELLGNGAELIHYLQRRSELRDALGNDVAAYDELDWLGCYLHESLEFREGRHLTDERTRVQLAGHSVDIDSYYLYKEGQRRTPAPKPKHSIQQEIRHLIDCMQVTGSQGWSELAILLLSLPHKLRRSFGKQLRKALARKTDRYFSVRTHDGNYEIVCGVGTHPVNEPEKSPAQVSIFLELDDAMAPQRASLVRDGTVVLEVTFADDSHGTATSAELTTASAS